MNHVMKEEEKFRMLHHVFDNEIEPFIIHLFESNNSFDSSDEL